MFQGALLRVAGRGSGSGMIATLLLLLSFPSRAAVSFISFLDSQVAEELSLLNGQGEPTTISTRLGGFSGRLERTRISIVADEGESLNVEATVWVSPDWPGHSFLGYGGLLERIRFAVDPSDNTFYFGPV